ncbi:ATP-binding cassette domain-containing protein [Mycolicibacterium smegmatis]|uniref:ATP binding protein of ABC transporter n=1 Tax=Mycolicibacterium smegmatis (strain MKD8) TaxID=1214915 RepID=A0A2U9PIB6_MYCSE|nr:ATP-binding cassette domain-containing protein [Mycolicibacterium smegmatis]AWT51469.1 ATP binding protein of ABC transporter [Mycolicibacterium smegmatis MKD8]
MSATAILSLTGITKSFVGVHALRGVQLDLFPGEVHALMGENGAGKSTLVKVLAGVYQPDGGSIKIGGEVTFIGNPEESTRAGIAVVHQDPILFPNLTVAESIFNEALPRTRLRRVRWKALMAKAGLRPPRWCTESGLISGTGVS